MRYLVIGAGGTGGSIAAYMNEAGKDVAVIARGKHLEAIKENGLRMETPDRGSFATKPIKAFDMENYSERPDVIFVCVKGYSLDDAIPFIGKVSGPDTVVIPILNIYGTGGRMQEKLPGILVTDGCIYIAAEISEPGTIVKKSDGIKVVFGTRKAEENSDALKAVKKDLEESGIIAVLSDNITRDTLQKFGFISPFAACGAYHDVSAGEFQKEGEIRDMFTALTKEILSISVAMGIVFETDLVKSNLTFIDSLSPSASASMQRDLKKGGASEIDGLVFEVVRMGRKYGVDVPVYEKVSEKFGFRI